MTDRAQFQDLVLDSEGLHTPEGLMPLGQLTKASFLRDLDKQDAETSGGGTNVAAVAGGAVVGGVLLGVPGAVGGAVIGAEVGQEPAVQRPRSSTVELVFETNGTAYRRDVAREDEHEAYSFVQDVKKAMKHG